MFQLEEVIDAKFPDLKRKPAMITRPALAFLRMMAGAERDRAHGEDLAVAFDLAERPRADAPRGGVHDAFEFFQLGQGVAHGAPTLRQRRVPK